MKKIILLTIALFATTLAFAQNFGTTQFATLSRNDSIIGTYYGYEAFANAYSDATDSDVITLSSGAFHGSNIDKAITIHGIGYKSDTNLGTSPTSIEYYGAWGMGLNIGSSATIIGVDFVNSIIIATNNINISKCRIHEAWGGGSQCTLTNCVIEEWHGSSYTILINSIILNALGGFNDTYYNCIIGISPSLTNDQNIYNCITYSDDTTSTGNAINVFNTLGIRINDTSSFYQVHTNHNNHTFHNFNSIFKTFNGTYTEGESFELQDNIANTLLGSDSTQIGIYGGALPFNCRVTDPRIIGHSADIHSNANGQINVYINLRNSNN